MDPKRAPGFRFKEGKLYAFKEDSVIILHGWPHLKAVWKHDDSARWEEFTPAFRVVRPYRRSAKKTSPQQELDFGDSSPRSIGSLAEQRKRAFDQFRFSMPKPVAQLTEKFQSHQWPVLKLLEGTEAAMDLARINPPLCYALANRSHFAAGLSFQAVLALARERQRVIAERLGFPNSEAVARVLSKMAPEAASPVRLQAFRDALSDPAVLKLLAHLPAINAGVLAIITEPSLLAVSTPKLLAEVAASPAERFRAETASLLRDTLSMLDLVRPDHGRLQVQSIARLRALHSDIGRDFLREHTDSVVNIRFPEPPFPGTRDIVPIRSGVELIHEGATQNNCVATYAKYVHQRSLFIYRVLRPERATLAIGHGADGDWTISELKAAGNHPVASSTRAFVAQWLDQFAMSA